MLIAPDVEITRLTFGKYKPEDQTNRQPSFSDASDAATLFERTLNNTTPRAPFFLVVLSKAS